MSRGWWSFMGALVIGVGLVGLAPPPGIAAQQSPPTLATAPCDPIVSIEGKDNYGAYCAVCHGKDGKGHGPAAPALRLPMPDLTRLAARNKGRFDELDVQYAIEGGGRMPTAHGTVDMPMWGPVFTSADSRREITRLRIRNLIRYLESIQVKPDR